MDFGKWCPESRYSQMERRLPFYESVFLVRADVSSQQVEALAQSFADIISDNGGSVAKTEHWGLRTLAYRIKKNRKAHYVLFNLDSPAAAVQEMERNMRLNEDVLRTMTLRVDELEDGPSAIVQSKGRDDRGRRDRPSRDGGAPREGDGPKPTGGDDGANSDAEPEETAKSDAVVPEIVDEPAGEAEVPALTEPDPAPAEAKSSDDEGDAK